MNRVLIAALTASVYLSLPLFGPALLAEEATHAEEHEHHEDGEHAGDTDHDEDEHDHHEGEAHGVRALHAWAQATSGKTALVFVEIENASDHDVMITGGETDIAGSVELVGFQLKDGEPDYVVLPPVPIRAGTEMTLAPNGLALRLNGVDAALVEGSEHEIEIEFDFGHIAMFFQVEAADARQHSHVGHQH